MPSSHHLFIRLETNLLFTSQISIRGTPFTSFCLELFIIDFFSSHIYRTGLKCGRAALVHCRYREWSCEGLGSQLWNHQEGKPRGDEATKRSTKGWSGCHDAWVFLCFSILFGLLLLVVHWLNFGGNHPGFGSVSSKKTLLLPKWCRPKISVEFWSWCLLLKGCWKISIVWLSCFSLSLIFVDL